MMVDIEIKKFPSGIFELWIDNHYWKLTRKDITDLWIELQHALDYVYGGPATNDLG